MIAFSSLAALWPLEPEAFAQAKGGAAGSGGASGADGKAAPAGGQAGGEKSGTGGASAPAEAQTKVVIYVEGAAAAEVKAEIEKALPPGASVLPGASFVDSLKKQGLLPLARSIKGPAERQKATTKLHIAVQDAGAQAAIVASAPAARGGKYDVAILIVPSDSAEALASVNANSTQPRAEVIAGIVSAAISGILPPAPPEPKATEVVAEEKKEPPKPKVEEKPPPPPPPPPTSKFALGKYQFEIGAGTQGRSFFYILPLGLDRGDLIKSYKLLVAPHVFVRADIYPLAGPGDTFPSNLGIGLLAGGTINSKTAQGDQKDIGTTFFHFRFGPKARFTLGPPQNPTVIAAELTYAHWDFTFTDPTGVAPSYVYQSVRPGGSIRQPIGPFALLFDLGLHYVVKAGELERRFPNATVLGFDAQLGFGVPIGSHFEARLNLNYNRYRGNLKAELDPDAPGATPYLAAGSVDQFFGAHLGAAYAF